ncbi:MAG: flagellar hook-associated protein FlgK [Acidimicrobiales bacterium]
MSNIGLDIAASGVNAAQTAMDTIAQNLSNTNTPGYVSETANLTALSSGEQSGVGGGVAVASVTQNNDSLLAANAAQTSAALAQSTALQQTLQQAQLAFGNPSSSTGLGADLSSFWQSWNQLSTNPTSQADLQAVVDSAQTVTTDLSQASGQITVASANASSQLATTVGQANTLLSQVASLNNQIIKQGATGTSVSSLSDQQSQLLTQLASDIGATWTASANGSVKVSVGGVTLVQGNWSDTLAVNNTGTASTPNLQLVAQSSKVALNASSGTTAGLLAAVNVYLPSYQSQLNTVASNLATSVNTVLSNGFTTSGAPGVDMFTSSGSGGLTAANISVNPSIAANPSLIATASTSSLPAATNDGSNAQALANLYNSPSGPDAAWRTAVVNVGSQVSQINNQVQAQTATSNAAQQNLQSVTGVNQNTALVELMNFQSTYQAAAKVITTVDTALQSLLAAV